MTDDTGANQPRAYGYTRLSQTSDTSIERQQRHIREYTDTHGYDLVEILNDGERTSGFNTGRSEYSSLKDLIRAGDVDAVIVHDRKRIGRDYDERMQFYFLLRGHGVEFHTYRAGHIDLTDPTDVAVEGIHAAKDHEAAEENIEAAREAVRERVNAGHYHGGPRYGTRFSADKTELVPDTEFSTVLDALAQRDRGATYTDIRDSTGIALGTLANIFDRREWYLSLADRHGYEYPLQDTDTDVDVPTEAEE